jgi:serine/threonine-protein kinase
MARVVEESTVPRGQVTPRATPTSTPSPSPPPAPQRLGRYQVLFELARGGIGTVFAARLTGVHGFDRLVAIKRLSAGGTGEEDVAAFLDEARLTARIRHPNVVQTLELVEDGGAPFIVMQLVEGVSFARLLRRLSDQGDALDAHLAAWIVAQAAAGLHAAHELRGPDDQSVGLVHRDVSPENVLLSYEGRVYVADFGVAKLNESVRSTKSGVVKGKFAYMSPEQTRAGVLDRRSDVFSLGVVLHEALSGQRLFAGSSPADTIRRISEEAPPDPRDLRADVPPDIVPIVMRCLEKRRDDRYDTAADVGEALRRFLRERRAPVDESDLAELLSVRFAEDRDRLRAKIRAAAVDGERPVEVLSGEPELTVSVAGRSGNGSVTAAIGTAPARNRRLLGTGAVLLAAAVVAGSIVMIARSGSSPSPTVPADTAAAAGSPTATPTQPPGADPAAARAAVPATIASTETPRAVSVALPSARPQPAPPKPAPPIGRPSAPRATSAPATATPAPPAPTTAPTSVKGVPFRDL